MALLVCSSVNPRILAGCGSLQTRKCRRAELINVSRKPLNFRYIFQNGAPRASMHRGFTHDVEKTEKVVPRHEAVVREVAKVVGLTMVFTAFTMVRGRVALAAPPSMATEVQTSENMEAQVEEYRKWQEFQIRMRQTVGVDDRLEEFATKRSERETEYRAALGVDELVKDLEAFARKNEGKTWRIREKLEEAKHKLRMNSRRVQGRMMIDWETRLGNLKQKQRPLVVELEKIVMKKPGLKEKLEEIGDWESQEPLESVDPEVDEFFNETKEIRSKLKPLVRESVGFGYEGWAKARYEVPESEEKYEAELERAVGMEPVSSMGAPSKEEVVAENLKATGDMLFEQTALPMAVNTQETLAFDVDQKLRSEVDGMVRSHLQLSGTENKRLLPGLKKNKLGSVELYSAYGSTPLEVPENTELEWCKENPEEMKIEIPEEKPEDVLVYRDRVLELTWYNEKLRRWEMEPAAVMYALSKELVTRVRLRQDRRMVFVSLKGEADDFAVNVKGLDSYLKDRGGSFKSLFAELKESDVPTTEEEMDIPLREWTWSEIMTVPFLLAWNLVQYVWNSDFFTTARGAYLSVLSGVIEEFMVRIGYPIIQKFPRMVRVFLGFELGKGDFSSPTWLMQWQKQAQENLEAKQPTLPWWMEFPFRSYVVVTPLLIFLGWAWNVILAIIGPTKFPENIIQRNIREQEKAVKELVPTLRQMSKEPIKRAFDQMKRIRNPEVSLKDFSGHEMFEEQVKEIVTFLRQPNAYKEIGARPPRGVLIVGESGTGKTTLARAIAAEARVPVVEIQSYDLHGGPSHVGQKAANVRELFKTARQFAPIILFMDNLDHSVGKRGSIASKEKQEQEALINQFLVELDGFETQEGVVVLATTSYPEKIDEALRRPGRMDRTIQLFPPTRSQREQILQDIAEKTMQPLVKDWVNWARIAEKTEGFTYIDLQPIPMQLQALSMKFKAGDREELDAALYFLNIYEKVVPRWIATNFLWKLDESVIDFLGLRPTKREIEIVSEYLDVRGASKPGIELQDPNYEWTRAFKHSPAVWAAGRGLVGLLLPDFDIVELIWLDRTNFDSVAFTKLTKNVDEGHLQTGTSMRSYYEKMLVLLHGSHIATGLLSPFMCKSEHSKPQLKEAARLATSMVLEFGWSLDDSPTVYMSGSSYSLDSSGHEKELEEKVAQLLDAAWDRTVQILTRNKHVLEAFVEELLERDYILKEDMQRILKDQNAIFEEEPFTLKDNASKNKTIEHSTNGTGRVITV